MQQRLTGETSFRVAVLKKDLASLWAEMGAPAKCDALAREALAIFRALDESPRIARDMAGLESLRESCGAAG